MLRLSSLLSAAALLVCTTACSADYCTMYSDTIESPCMILLKNNTKYEVRQYPGTEMWTSAHINSRSFALAQQKGFMANFDYISGANEGEKKIPMTSPVLFRPAAEDNGWEVSFYVPSKFEDMEAVPKPKNEAIKIISLGAVTYAVRVFSGFATIWDFTKAEAALKKDLLIDGVETVQDKNNGVVWAGYDSPFVYTNRHNEVWVRIA